MDDPFRDPFKSVLLWFILVVSVLRCTASFVFSENSGVQIGGGNARLVLADPEDNVHNSMVSRVSDLSLLFRK